MEFGWILVRLGGLLGTSWGVLGRLGGVLGASWGVLGASCRILGFLEASWAVLEASWAPKPPQDKPVLIRNGKRVCLFRVSYGLLLFLVASVVRLEKTYQKCQNTLQNLPRKPFKIQVWRVILAVILELWAAPNINLYFLLFFAPFFSTSGSSRSRLGRQVGAKLALKRHPINLKNQQQKSSKFKNPSGAS